MGLDKFLDDDFDKLMEEKESLHIPKNDYKRKVNEAVSDSFNNSHDFNLLNLEKEDVVDKKVPMSVYFRGEDLELLKAIAYDKNTTVNKIIMGILQEPLDVTRKNLPDSFNIKSLSNKYDKKCRKRKNI